MTDNKKRHVLLCGAVHPDGMKLLEDAADTSYEVIADNSDELEQRLPDADALVIRICDMKAELLDKAPRLKAVSRHGVGCDNLPVEELTRRNIPVMITGSANAEAVSEHTIYLLLALARRGVSMDKAVRDGNWSERASLGTFNISGKQALVLGCGRIGRLVVNKLAALGMDVIAYDPNITPDVCAELDADCGAGVEAELPEADVVTLHMPSIGKAVIGEDEIRLMQRHALLINVSRGDLVDEEALASALAEKRIGGAGLDVLAQEPPPANHPLLGLDNVVFTPHTAALTDESVRAMGISCVQNALDVLDGKPEADNVFNPGSLNS